MIDYGETIRGICSANVRVDALTLWGIGPYFYRSRLEIRPLTIICGENGSGKSWWLKAAHFLKDVANDLQFPVNLSINALPVVGQSYKALNSIGFENEWDDIEQYLYWVKEETQSESFPWERWGTIGIEATVLRDIDLLKQGSEKLLNSYDLFKSEAERVCQFAKFKVGDTVRVELQLGPEESGYDNLFYPDKVSRVVVYRNGIPDFELSEVHTFFSPHPQSLKCGFDIWGKSNLVQLGLKYFRDKSDKKKADSIEPADVIDVALCEFGYECARLHLLEITKSLNMVFANRACIDDPDVETREFESQMAKAIAKRSVGEYGDATIPLERALAPNQMLQAGGFTEADTGRIVDSLLEPYSYFSPKDIEEVTIEERRKRLFATSEERPRDWDPDILASLSTEILRDGEFFDAISSIPGAPLVRYTDGLLIHALHWYIRYWLEALLGAGPDVAEHFVSPPCGFLFDRRFHPRRGVRHSVDGRYLSSIYTQSTLQHHASTSAMSSGFHHLFPFIVQSGVMWNGDTFFLESPEAHLHPSLQTKLTEFFLLHANTGRQYVLETHSDLIVRRVLRAILEETISQDNVRIYFTRIDGVLEHPGLKAAGIKLPKNIEHQFGRERTSYIEEITVNKNGQIANWPPGFMDEDVLEARRLMDAMYGGVDEEEENE